MGWGHPKTAEGRISNIDEQTLRGFRSILDETFQNDLALRANVKTSSARSTSTQNAVVDGDNSTYWEAGENQHSATLEVELETMREFDRVVLQEAIWSGQRISRFVIQALEENRWKQVVAGTTVGYKRILRTSPVLTDKVRIVIQQANNPPALSTVSFFKASKRER